VIDDSTAGMQRRALVAAVETVAAALALARDCEDADVVAALEAADVGAWVPTRKQQAALLRLVLDATRAARGPGLADKGSPGTLEHGRPVKGARLEGGRR
jgi:hypothetical protein